MKTFRMGTRAPLILALILATLPQVCGAGLIESRAADAHGRMQCSLCHRFDSSSETAVFASASNDAACIGCHGMIPSEEPDRLGFHGQPGRRCTDCHSFHEPSRFRSALGEGVLKTDGGRAGDHCAACHFLDANLSLVSPGHREAAELYHAGGLDLSALSPSEACLSCHSSQNASYVSENLPADGPIFNEHASHAYGVVLHAGASDPRLRIRPVLDARIRLFDDRIECVTCHQLAGEDEDLLVEFEQRYELCLGCHEQGSESQAASERLAMGR